jgi:hypothetical protein
MSRRDPRSDLFALEALEGRVLLSGDPGVAMTPPPETQGGAVIEQAWLESKPSAVDAAIDGLAESSPVDSEIFGEGGEAWSPSDAVDSPTAPVDADPNSAADTESEEVVPEGVIDPVPAQPDFDPKTPSVIAEPVVPAAGANDEMSPLLSQLVTTLRVGNAPPNESMQALSMISDSAEVSVDQSVTRRSLGLMATTISGFLETNTTWSGTISVTGDLNIQLGAVLTIEPGTVIKVARGAIIHVIGATVLARGTAAAPIIFTAARDDSVGEDISGEGTSTAAAGDWESLIFHGGSGGSVLENVEIRYSGMTAPGNNDLRDAVIIQQGASPTLQDVRIRDVGGNALRVIAGSPVLRRVDVQRRRAEFRFTSPWKRTRSWKV